MLCEVGEGTVHRLWEPLAAKPAVPNAYAGKFSTPFCVARRLRARRLRPRGLHRGTWRAIRAYARSPARCANVVDPNNPYPNNFTGHIRATLRNGSVVEERQAHFRGGAHEPLSRAAIEAKFAANAAFGGWSAGRIDQAMTGATQLFDGGAVDLSPLRA